MGTLTEIRDACLGYVARDVVVVVENLKADNPNAISPGEGFGFDLKWTHKGMIPLINVRLYVAGEGAITLFAPADAYLAKTGTGPIPEGTPANHMFLFPSDPARKRIGSGETDSWPGLRGRADKLGGAIIQAVVIADLDLDWLFSPNQTGKSGSLAFNVV